MAGFEYRFRANSQPPTRRRLVFKNTEQLSRGDFVNYEDGQVDLAVMGDTALVGACQETIAGTAAETSIEVITDSDAVYGVDDAVARREGDGLDVTGATGAQGVASNGSAAFTVLRDSTRDEETLVRVDVDRRHVIAPQRESTVMGGELNDAVARAVVSARRKHMGRGPTKAGAFHRGNLLTVMLYDVMTTAERLLATNGHADMVMTMRQGVQDVMRRDLVPVVERLTGCTVLASLGGSSVDPDVEFDMFVLDRSLGEP
jgi:uncharacterized protein YbcI